MFFLTRCRISKCQGLGPKKHDEISEIDRTTTTTTAINKSNINSTYNNSNATYDDTNNTKCNLY